MADIKARVSTSSGVQAKVAIVPPQKITDLTDVDASLLDDGAVMVYDLATQKFIVKPDMDNAKTRIIGGSF